jgi:single-stranded-DNA-specific exonuclease
MVTWVFVHGDSDGVCSGALALAANPDARVFFTNPVELTEDLKRVDEGSPVIICDIALNGETLPQVLENMRALSSKNTLLYIDHHPLPPSLDLTSFPAKVIHELAPCASELTYRTFKDRLPRKTSRIAIYGAIGDYADDTPFIQGLLRDWDKRTLYFEAGVLVQGLEGSRRDMRFKHEIVRLLSRNRLPSSSGELLGRALTQTHEEERLLARIEDTVRRVGEVAYVLDIGASVSKAATYARVVAGASVGIAGETVNGIVDMSLRTERDDLDLNAILRDTTQRFGGTGGGHPKASGARIPSASFEKFVEALSASVTSPKTKSSCLLHSGHLTIHEADLTIYCQSGTNVLFVSKLSARSDEVR